MPTVFVIFGIRFFFYKNDHDPIHVHVAYQGKTAKIKVHPNIELVYNHGLKESVLKKAMEIAGTFQEEIIKEWYKNFPK